MTIMSTVTINLTEDEVDQIIGYLIILNDGLFQGSNNLPVLMNRIKEQIQ